MSTVSNSNRISRRISEVWSDITFAQKRAFELNLQPRQTNRPTGHRPNAS